ncbi:MAG: hypothetical protein QG552_2540 [Thermodesulfobacteriota bacterium]|nr:hypothetical protein [Thermodesulfobacteriota bacterium]
MGKLKKKTKAVPGARGNKAIQAYAGSILKDLHALPEKVVLNSILEHPAPRQLIQRLPSEDFFWLIKRMDEEGTLQLLRLASVEQWQYVLDLELWQKDRLDMEETSLWLGRLQSADPGRLTGWLFTDGQALAYDYLFRNIQVEIRDEDEVYDFDEGFITLDGLFYIKVADPDRMETIEAMLRTMADADFLKYQSLLSGLAGVVTAELEEDMYRMKNIRLAEHGFLPREEALLVYAPLQPDALKPDGDPGRMIRDVDEDVLDMAPYSPLVFVEGRSLLTKTLSRLPDSRFTDRVRLEFAGLCNQVLSADGFPTDDIDVLKRACRKSAGYMNLILEKLCGEDVTAAEALLKNNPLMSLFRTGFGLALKLKWEAERWLKESWFRQKGLGFDFWGEDWGYTLSALTANRPLYYDMQEGDGVYRGFEHDSELTEVSGILHRVMGLDALLARLAAEHPLDQAAGLPPGLTFHSLLFTLWARRILNLSSSFEGISLNEAKDLFRFLRSGDDRPPYQMAAYEDVFVNDFLAAASGWDPEVAITLKDTLTLIWGGFCREYEQVPLNALDRRFSPYIAIRPSR